MRPTLAPHVAYAFATARSALGQSHRKIADKPGIDQATLLGWKAGRICPPVSGGSPQLRILPGLLHRLGIGVTIVDVGSVLMSRLVGVSALANQT
jgi:hypothetical protein